MDESEVCKKNVDRQEEMLSRNMDAAARMKKIEDQLRRAIRHLRSRSSLRLIVGFSKMYCEL
jgi:hypothetical protein